MPPLIKSKKLNQTRNSITGKSKEQELKGLIEEKFDVSFIAKLALKEKQIQQFVRPVIAVHKWFARRPGTLFRALALSEFSDKPLQESFYISNDFPKKKVLDPFMGGGTPILEANRIGCDVYVHISEQSGHPFRTNPATHFGVKAATCFGPIRPPLPVSLLRSF